MNMQMHSTGAVAPATIAITERMDTLTSELSELMGQYGGGRWISVVRPRHDVRLVPAARMESGTIDAFLAAAPVSSVIEYHLTQLTIALRKQTPGTWIGHLFADGSGARVFRDPEATKSEAWISFEVEP